MGTEIELQSQVLLFKCCRGLKIDYEQLLRMANKILELSLRMTDLNILMETAFEVAMICNENSHIAELASKQEFAANLYLQTKSYMD